jgi:hypothetical protein
MFFYSMAGNISSNFNQARFGAMNRNPSGFGGSGFSIAGGNTFGAPAGFGGVGSFGGGFGGGFNSFANPYAFGGNIGGFGAGAAWAQFAFAAAFAIPQIIQGIQSLVQARRENSGGEECGPCSGGDHHNNSGHPDMNVHETYIDGQDGHRIDDAGVNVSFEMDY